MHIGDATLEGAEEGFIGIGDKWYQRNVLGEDVNIFEGFYDNFSAGFVGGGYFKAPWYYFKLFNTCSNTR